MTDLVAAPTLYSPMLRDVLEAIGVRPRSLVLVLAGLLTGPAVAPVGAQPAGQSPRTIEPRMTRLFSSDSLEVSGPKLSPDGRWVLFSTYAAESGNLWVVPAAGGDPVRLTTGRHSDMDAAWFPSGERIAFRSDRPSAPGNPQTFLMVLPFDSRTGQAAGSPRQVSLDHVNRFAISPDGQWIAYNSRRDTVSSLRLIPAAGGTARLLAEVYGRWGALIQEWSSDGAFVYFTQRRTGTLRTSLMRVPAKGGAAQEVTPVPFEGREPRISVVTDLLLTLENRGPGQTPLVRLSTLEGRALAGVAISRSMIPTGFTPDGRGLMAIQTNMVAPIRVVPLAGGPVRQLSEARAYDWPLGWRGDGSVVYAATQANGQNAILELPMAGGPARQWSIPAGAKDPGPMSRDGRYVAYGVIDSSQTDDLRTLVIHRLSDGQARIVTRALHRAQNQPTASGPGGRYGTTGDEFLYFERRGDRLELRSTSPEGPPRLLRSFPSEHAVRTSFGVHGTRIAYTEGRGDSTAIFLADGPTGQPRLLVTIAGGASQPAWSHDGRSLAFDYYPPGDAPRYKVLVIGLGADGKLSMEPRILDAGPQWGWTKQWLPDDRGLTVFGMTGVASQTHVYLVSLREGERPVALTRDDNSTRWWYELSPDGRHVAYPAEISRGSSIWRLDLPESLTQRTRR